MKNKAFVLRSPILDSIDLLLEMDDVEVRRLKYNEILIKNICIGVNILDLYIAKGLLYNIKTPEILGIESVGIVQEIGIGVPKSLSIGDKVINILSRTGAFAEYRICNYSDIFVINNRISEDLITAFLYKSMMSKVLMYNASFVLKNMNILITNPVSDLGCIFTQFLRDKIGETGVIIGCIDLDEDAEIAMRYGCNFVIKARSSIEEHRSLINEYTSNIGVNIVYDSHQDANIFFDKAIASLIQFGCYTYYGDSFGRNIDLDFKNFAKKSLFLSMPNFFNAINKDYSLMAFGLLDIIYKFENNIINCNIINKYSFEDIPNALKDLRDGNVKGGSIVVTL